MKKAIVAAAVALTVAFTGGVAMASSCPKVIKEGRDAAAKMKADDPKVKGALAKLDEAQKLHDGGKHAESLANINRSTKVDCDLSDLGRGQVRAVAEELARMGVDRVLSSPYRRTLCTGSGIAQAFDLERVGLRRPVGRDVDVHGVLRRLLKYATLVASEQPLHARRFTAPPASAVRSGCRGPSRGTARRPTARSRGRRRRCRCCWRAA